jgi:hypothetical protein
VHACAALALTKTISVCDRAASQPFSEFGVVCRSFVEHDAIDVLLNATCSPVTGTLPATEALTAQRGAAAALLALAKKVTNSLSFTPLVPSSYVQVAARRLLACGPANANWS